MNPDPARPNLGSGNYIRHVRLLLILVIIAFAYLYRLDRPPLWNDEADTGIEARNILKYGYPIVYDGRNISVYVIARQLNKNLLCS